MSNKQIKVKKLKGLVCHFLFLCLTHKRLELIKGVVVLKHHYKAGVDSKVVLGWGTISVTMEWGSISYLFIL